MSQTSIEIWTIGKLVELSNRRAFQVQPEYQRGIVWKPPHMKLLIDSAMRGYGMPMLYLRPHERGEVFDIIDGQQRINVFRGFTSEDGLVLTGKGVKEGLRLLNPCLPSEMMYFPTFQQKVPCDWGGKRFSEFSKELRDYFLGREVPVTLLHFPNEQARDMFVRLQGGYDLSSQEKRDAWLGDFCDQVLRIGGKPEMNRRSGNTFSGHPFFREVMWLNPETDRGKTRQMAAQMMMLFLYRDDDTRAKFTGINGTNIDACYRRHVVLSESDGNNLRRCRLVLDKLTSAFRDWIKRKDKLQGHEAIHLVLFADMLSSGAFEDEWQNGMFSAFCHFRRFAPSQYSDKIGNKSSNGSVIAERHAIFVKEMLQNMDGDIRAKDLDDPGNPPPDFKEAIFYRDDGKCCTCKRPVQWEYARAHQVSSKRGVNACDLLDVYELRCDKCP